MIVVSDTSPLNYLVLIEHADLLPKLFADVYAPPGVMTELSHPGAPEPVRRFAASPPSWLQVRAPANVDLPPRLGLGEREALALALELGAEVVLVDEELARAEAVARGLRPAGVLYVLALAAERRLIDLPTAFSRLERTNFRRPEALMKELLRRFGPEAGKSPES